MSEEGKTSLLQGVVLKLRKVSRRLAFATLQLDQTTADVSLGAKTVQVMFLGDQETDWRTACFPDGDGKKVCCGSAITAVCIPDTTLARESQPAQPEHSRTTQDQERTEKRACFQALRCAVVFSPQDHKTQSGSVRQHPAVERMAAVHHDVNSGAETGLSESTERQAHSIPPLCRLWWKGKCVQEEEPVDFETRDGKGEAPQRRCWRRHYFLDEQEKVRFETLRDKSTRMQADEEGGVFDDPHAQENKASKSKSDVIFVEWLLSTFGREELQRGGGVVDVAGGRGSVSFELVSKHQVPCTLIDPRPLRLSKSQQRSLSKRRVANGHAGGAQQWWRALEDPGDGPSSSSLAGDENKTGNGNGNGKGIGTSPQAPQASGGERGGGGGGGAEQSRGSGAAEVQGGGEAVAEGGGRGGAEVRDRKEEKKGEARGEQRGAELVHMAAAVDEESAGEGEVGRVLGESSVLIGMHPDQATEAIVRAALRYGKPFAVVPCCVFPSEFQFRRTRGGAPVVRYADFVQYLLDLDPGIQHTYLPFKGRNKVLFRRHGADARL